MRAKDVFINCPFDSSYKPIFDALIFAIYDLGFRARSALEIDDSSQNRLEKIQDIIEDCRYSIHDLSFVALDATTRLPRFNMALELGIYLGCKRYSKSSQRKRAALILDKEPHRYKQSTSDIGGFDIHAHNAEPSQAIIEVRDWLSNISKRKGLPGGQEIVDRYARFRRDLRGLCKRLRRRESELTYADLSEMITEWLKSAARVLGS